MGRSQREKGAKAEREVALICQGWLRQTFPKAVVRRTPLSGGWAGAGEFGMRGDLQVRAAVFPWVVEVKRREGWSLENFIAGKRSPVWAWWVGVCAEAEKDGLSPMLWVRQSRMDWVVVLEREFVARSKQAPMHDYGFGYDSAPVSVMPIGYDLRRFLEHPPGRWYATGQ